MNAFTIITPFVVIKRLSRKLRIIINIHTKRRYIFSFKRKIPKEKSFSTRRMLKFELDQAYLLKYSKRGILLF
ncbi:hypothetical protein CHBNIV1_17170 [Haemophilus influenzae]|nr:hypothetical protein CHBNIV1_17170 [Haemophilus influenzae]